MFIQVMQGQATDREALERTRQRWADELRAGAVGFLGATFGVTDDGWVVNAARFESEEAARKNSDRPEQGAWWNEFVQCLEGEPEVIEGSDVDLLIDGGSDDASFVQAMSGRASDRAKLAEIEDGLEEQLKAARPDLIGSWRLWQDDGSFTQLAYFRSEEEARVGEKAEPPAEVAERFQTWDELMGALTYRDLRDVRLTGPPV
jgi:hypothetical protein